MRQTGTIVAALDCDPDAVREYNRWYDLEHLPPNAAMEGVVSGRRYVAPPELHQLRRTRREEFADGRSSFLTVYGICVEPDVAMKRMVDLRQDLVDAGRMSFPDDKKAVRLGEAAALRFALPDPAIRSTPSDVLHVGHTGIDLVIRRSGDAVSRWYEEDFARRVVATSGVVGIASYRAGVNFPDWDIDMIFLDGDPAQVHQRRLDEVEHHVDADVELDAPFQLIQPLSYPWADRMSNP